MSDMTVVFFGLVVLGLAAVVVIGIVQLFGGQAG